MLNGHSLSLFLCPFLWVSWIPSHFKCFSSSTVVSSLLLSYTHKQAEHFKHTVYFKAGVWHTITYYSLDQSFDSLSALPPYLIREGGSLNDNLRPSLLYHEPFRDVPSLIKKGQNVKHFLAKSIWNLLHVFGNITMIYNTTYLFCGFPPRSLYGTDECLIITLSSTANLFCFVISEDREGGIIWELQDNINSKKSSEYQHDVDTATGNHTNTWKI